MSEQPASRPDVPQWDTADRVRKALRTAQVGVQELADYLEVDRSTVSTWINGRNDPAASTLRLIAMRCGVSYTWLKTGETEPESDRPDPGPGTISARHQGEGRRQLAPELSRAPAHTGTLRRLVAA